MSSMPWVKVWIEMLDDVKLAGLTDSQKWRFVQLVLLAGECDAAGALVTGESRMTHKQIAWRLRCDEKTLESDIKMLAEIGLIYEDNALVITNFSTRQGPTQEIKRKQWAERQKKRRDRVKIADVTGESRMTHANVTPLEEEEEEEEEEEQESKSLPQLSGGIFALYEQTIGLIPPVLVDELKQAEIDYPIDWIADAFKETARQGKHNWKYTAAILRSWKDNGSKRTGTKAENTPVIDPRSMASEVYE